MTFRSLGVVLACACFGVVLSGCPGQQTINTLTQHLSINPVQAGGGFVGYTNTTFGQSIPAGKKVHLLSAKLESSSGEFSWVTSLVGSVGTTDAPVLVQKTSFAGASSPTELDVVDTGDLRPLSPDGQSFRIDWLLEYAPVQTMSYPNGIELTFTYQVQIE